MRLLFWGTYDKGKPRVRILIRGLQENNVEVTECHSDVWADVEDKSQVSGFIHRIIRGIFWLTRYPSLIWKFVQIPKHEAVVIPYMGQLDVLMLWPFAKLRKMPIIWDAFLSLYNTVVEDRKLIGRYNPLSWILFCWEWLACKAADVVILDTQAHADYFIDTFKIPAEKTHVIFVGAEPECFPRANSKQIEGDHETTVLFYGQFIPLHGVETIVSAAKLTQNNSIRWIIIGSGQEQNKIRKILEEDPINNLIWIPWVNYNELIDWIQKADICLGIFGDTDKAARVIPNKVFQILMSGKPLITRDSPAIRELLRPEMNGVRLIEPANPEALISSIREIGRIKDSSMLHQDVCEIIQPLNIGKQLISYIENFIKKN